MAKLTHNSLKLATEQAGEAFLDFLNREDEALELLRQKSDALPANVVVGRLYSHPYADGYAYYLVTSEKPFTVQHVAVGDNWQLPAAHVRGLTRADVLEGVARKRAFSRIFKKAS